MPFLDKTNQSFLSFWFSYYFVNVTVQLKDEYECLYTNNGKLFLWYDTNIDLSILLKKISSNHVSANDDATGYVRDQAVDSVIYSAALEATFN